jgi:hypothetical protein
VLPTRKATTRCHRNYESRIPTIIDHGSEDGEEPSDVDDDDNEKDESYRLVEFKTILARHIRLPLGKASKAISIAQDFKMQ